MNFETTWKMDGKPVYVRTTMPPEVWTIYWRNGVRELVTVPYDIPHTRSDRAIASSNRNPCLPQKPQASFDDDEYWHYYQQCQQEVFEIREGVDDSWRWQEDSQEWLPIVSIW